MDRDLVRTDLNLEWHDVFPSLLPLRARPWETRRADIPSAAANPPETFPPDESLEAKMARRFPQKVKVADLIGLPVLDD
jgi:hypothetical protein